MRGQTPAAPPNAAPALSVKNSLGIISIRRVDCEVLTAADVGFIKSHISSLDPSNLSLFKNTLRVFCASKPQLQSVWETLTALPAPASHCGYHTALPGVSFPTVKLECRVPAVYKGFKKQLLVKQFLEGCPGFHPGHVKCNKDPVLLSKELDVNKKVG